ncbi:MAG: hypothetical protein IT258_17065 [Saprospiraceae bacterium]|nr:hypothetical protein [Saprospiraceae bacterium]
MSDFSFHYHLKSEDQQAAVQLLQNASVRGYVFPPVNGWVTFVVEDELSSDVPASNKGILIEMFRTNDFPAWGFSIYQEDKLICKYKLEGEDGEIPNFKDYSKEAINKIVPADKVDEIESLLNSWETESGSETADYGFARIVGLEHIDWVSFHYVESDFETYVEQYGNLITV